MEKTDEVSIGEINAGVYNLLELTGVCLGGFGG